jgi:hypothetical protein
MRHVVVDFGKPLRGWDGFGVNYVQACQTPDYAARPQDYGGFSILSEAERRQIVEMVFGDGGLRPGLVKMFLDPFHQDEPGPGYKLNDPVIDPAAYDHETTTEWMRQFVREGAERTRARGGKLSVITALYGPPAGMTKQKVFRGRDLDPELKVECAKYMVAWAKHLREVEDLRVDYVSLHNEGEDYWRWASDGTTRPGEGQDYNLYWPPEQVVEFVKLVGEVLRANGLSGVGVTPGETSNWYRFHHWGYADALADDAEATAALGLITSHGFHNPKRGMGFGDWRSAGIDTLRAVRSDLRAWVTSTSWSEMDVFFLDELRHHVYSAKVNGIIPWACIQRNDLWAGGDPNPGTAFRVLEHGGFRVEPGYHYYRQVCRAGAPGTTVVRAWANDSEVGLLGFGSAGSGHPDAFVVLNLSDHEKDLTIEVPGADARAFEAFRTSPEEQCAEIGGFDVSGSGVRAKVPPLSATTLTAV